jgi:protein SCO1/2
VSRTSTLLLVAAAVLLAASPSTGQMTGAPSRGYRSEPGLPASAVPAPLREIGFDQNLSRQVPFDVVFRDERGGTVRLGEYFRGRAVVLAFVFYECPMLCTQVLGSLARSLDVLSLEPGRDFEIVTVSIDPRETPQQAAEKKTLYLERYDRTGAADAWHFLTGDEASIRRLAAAAGFRYAWDEATQQYAHPAGIAVLTPDGRVARYLFGIEYGPRDLRLALVEASEGRIGSPIDSLLLYCYHYDPMRGGYGLVVMRVLRVAGVATVLVIAGFIALMLRRERRQDRQARARGPVHQAQGLP